MPFADHTSALRWGGKGVTKPCEVGNYKDCMISFNATDAGGELVMPAGSTWRRCPIPRAPWAWDDTGASFEPACKESEACSGYHGPKFSGPGCQGDMSSCSTGTFPCECSGWGIGDLFRLEIVDKLRLPADLPAGDWVLGWRCASSRQAFLVLADSSHPNDAAPPGDCEESTQVWASCSDVTIKAAK